MATVTPYFKKIEDGKVNFSDNAVVSKSVLDYAGKLSVSIQEDIGVFKAKNFFSKIPGKSLIPKALRNKFMKLEGKTYYDLTHRIIKNYRILGYLSWYYAGVDGSDFVQRAFSKCYGCLTKFLKDIDEAGPGSDEEKFANKNKVEDLEAIARCNATKEQVGRAQKTVGEIIKLLNEKEFEIVGNKFLELGVAGKVDSVRKTAVYNAVFDKIGAAGAVGDTYVIGKDNRTVGEGNWLAWLGITFDNNKTINSIADGIVKKDVAHNWIAGFPNTVYTEKYLKELKNEMEKKPKDLKTGDTGFKREISYAKLKCSKVRSILLELSAEMDSYSKNLETSFENIRKIEKKKYVEEQKDKGKKGEIGSFLKSLKYVLKQVGDISKDVAVTYENWEKYVSNKIVANYCPLQNVELKNLDKIFIGKNNQKENVDVKKFKKASFKEQLNELDEAVRYEAGVLAETKNALVEFRKEQKVFLGFSKAQANDDEIVYNEHLLKGEKGFADYYALHKPDIEKSYKILNGIFNLLKDLDSLVASYGSLFYKEIKKISKDNKKQLEASKKAWDKFYQVYMPAKKQFYEVREIYFKQTATIKYGDQALQRNLQKNFVVNTQFYDIYKSMRLLRAEHETLFSYLSSSLRNESKMVFRLSSMIMFLGAAEGAIATVGDAEDWKKRASELASVSNIKDAVDKLREMNATVFEIGEKQVANIEKLKKEIKKIKSERSASKKAAKIAYAIGFAVSLISGVMNIVKGSMAFAGLAV